MEPMKLRAFSGLRLFSDGVRIRLGSISVPYRGCEAMFGRISGSAVTRRVFEKASFRLKRDLDVILEVVAPRCTVQHPFSCMCH